MKTIKQIGTLLILALLISGCISFDKEPEPQKPTLAQQYMAKGQALEKESRYTSALEQYRLALAVEPENPQARQHEKDVLARLWGIAQQRYNKGLALEKEGKHEAARKEYLSALQNWPDHKEAKAKLTPGGVSDDSAEYIVHTIASGESVSKIAMIYYGDYKKHVIIGKFNVLKDVTKVRVGEKIKVPAINGFPLSTLKEKQKTYLAQKEAEPSAMQDTTTSEQKDYTTVTEQPLTESEELPPEQPAENMARETEETMTPDTMPTPDETETIQAAVPAAEPEPLQPPQSEPAVQPESDHIEKAVALFNEKKYTESIPIFEAAAQSNPDDDMVKDYLHKSHFQQAMIEFNKQDYLAAKDNFQAALNYNENCEKCPGYIEKSENTFKEKHYNLGIHYFGKEQLKKAIEEWTLVKDLDPDYKDVTPNLKKAQLLYQRLESIKKSTTE